MDEGYEGETTDLRLRIASLEEQLESAQAALSAARERIREMGSEIEAAYREGYHQRSADEFGVSTRGSTPDVDFAWEHSEAKQGASASRVAGEGATSTVVQAAVLKAFDSLFSVYRAKYTRPGIGGIRVDAPFQTEVGELRIAVDALRTTKGEG